MKPTLGTDGNYHSFKELMRTRTKLYYWVVIPQGVVKHTKRSSWYSKTIEARTLKMALRLQKRYNAPIVEKVIYGPYGRFIIRKTFFDPRPEEQIWLDARNLPEIDLTQLKEDNSPSNQDKQDNTDYGYLGG